MRGRVVMWVQAALLLGATLCMLPGTALATEYIVDINGSGDFTSIQDCIDWVRYSTVANTCNVLPGTYNEALSIYFCNGEVTLRGTNRSTTIIDGSGWVDLPAIGIIASNVRITDLTIKNGSSHGVIQQDADVSYYNVRLTENGKPDNPTREPGGAIAAVAGGTASIRGCLIDNNLSAFRGTVSAAYGSSLEIMSSEIRDNTAPGGVTLSPDDEYDHCDIRSSAIVNNCTEYFSSPTCLGVVAGDLLNLDLNYMGYVNLYEVTIAASDPYYENYSVVSSGTPFMVRSSILYSPALPTEVPFWAFPGAYPTFDVRYSNVRGGYPGLGNISADPLFMSAVSPMNIHLSASSPCIDAGDPFDVFSMYDIDLGSRLLDGNNDGTSRVDMGADEFVYTAPPYTGTANAEAAAYGASSLSASGTFNALALFLVPAAAAVVWRIARRRRR